MQMSFQQALSLAIQQHQAGAFDAAENLYRQLLAHAPAQPELLHLFGVLHLQCQRAAEACELIGRASELAPQREDFRNNLGLALQAQGRLDEAIATFEAALALRPDYAEAWNNLGNALHLAQRPAEALAPYRRAAELMAQPGAKGQILHHLAVVYEELGELAAAGESFTAAAKLLPQSAAVWSDLAQNALARGRPELAAEAYARARSLARDDLKLASAALFSLLLLPEADLAARRDAFRAWGELARTQASQAEASERLEQADSGHASGDDSSPGSSGLASEPGPGAPDSGRRLRIGYVCSNFSGHSSRSTLLPLYRERDREGFEIYSYAAVRQPDALTAEFRRLSDHWREILDWSDARLAAQIRADGIDILVDFNGHTLDHRLACFARKPAPLQLTGLGFGASTGLAAIDYRLADTCLVPPEQQELQADRIWYLPLAFCYAPPEDAPAPQPAPRHANGFITFGSGNRLFKLNEQVLACWAEMLHACPGSRLRLKSPELDDAGLCSELRARFAAAGIAPERIDLLGRTDRAGQLAFYTSLDICLDTFPYDGGISSCEALWMGLPVLALSAPDGQRCAVTLLSRLGLANWLASDPADYIARGLRLAADGPGLDALRFSLRERLAASPICDGPAYTRAIEAAYRELRAQSQPDQPKQGQSPSGS